MLSDSFNTYHAALQSHSQADLAWTQPLEVLDTSTNAAAAQSVTGTVSGTTVFATPADRLKAEAVAAHEDKLNGLCLALWARYDTRLTHSVSKATCERMLLDFLLEIQTSIPLPSGAPLLAQRVTYLTQRSLAVVQQNVGLDSSFVSSLLASLQAQQQRAQQFLVQACQTQLRDYRQLAERLWSDAVGEGDQISLAVFMQKYFPAMIARSLVHPPSLLTRFCGQALSQTDGPYAQQQNSSGVYNSAGGGSSMRAADRSVPFAGAVSSSDDDDAQSAFMPAITAVMQQGSVHLVVALYLANVHRVFTANYGLSSLGCAVLSAGVDDMSSQSLLASHNGAANSAEELDMKHDSGPSSGGAAGWLTICTAVNVDNLEPLMEPVSALNISVQHVNDS